MLQIVRSKGLCTKSGRECPRYVDSGQGDLGTFDCFCHCGRERRYVREVASVDRKSAVEPCRVEKPNVDPPPIFDQR
jgi:hypothetical protein